MAQTNDKQKVWILERYDSPLKVYEDEGGKKADPYTFVGPAADFNGVNDNDRMYSKEDYLEHIDTYLKEEINENALLGELDHNEDYMVSMKNISHMIKDLWYDDDSGQVMIKIKLLNTRDGKDAMAIADEGAPIYISSRASGYIDESGNVTLEKIYTYDIVYRPGFKNAKLKPVNEDVIKKYSNKKKSIALYEWKDENNSSKSSAINKSNPDSKQTNKNMKNYATKEDIEAITESFENYTQGLSKTLESFKSSILTKLDEAKQLHVKSGKQTFENKKPKAKKINEDGGLGGEENPQTNVKTPDAETTIEPQQDDDDSAERNQEQNDEFMDKINDLEQTVNNGIAEKESLIDYIQGMTDRVNGHGDYMNVMSQFCNKMADFMDLISKRVNDVTDYGDTIAERVNDVTDYGEATAERVNDITDYTDMISERTNQLHSYSEKIAENQNKLRDYSSKSIKSLNESLKRANETGSERVKRVMENKLGKENSKLILKKGDITNLTNKVLESVKKKGIDKNVIILETKYPFVKHLNGGTRSLFESLDEIRKRRVSSILKTKRTLTNEGVADVVNQVNEDNEAYRLLRNIPKKYIPVWESLDTKAQNQVISLSRTKDLRTDYEVELFWESLDFGDVVQNVSESQQATEISALSKEVIDGVGYGDSDIDQSLGIS